MATMGRIGTAVAVIVLEYTPQLAAGYALSADQNAEFFVFANTRSMKPASSIRFSWAAWLKMAA